MSDMFSLHRWLLLDKVEKPIISGIENKKLGSMITGWATIIFTLGCISGLIIWFPQKLKSWKQGLKIKWRAGWKRLNHVSAQYPMKLFAKDIDNNGSIDPVMFYYIKTDKGERKLSPAIGKDMLTSQVPSLKKKFVLHKEYINTGVDDIFSDKTNLLELTCEETATCYIENLGNGIFFKHTMPIEAQFAPVNTILCHDFDGDGHTDLLFAGNEYQTEVMTGRYDASYGLFLKGNSNRDFIAYSPAQSGFVVNGDVKNMKLLNTTKAGNLVLVAINNDSLKTYRVALTQPPER